MYLVFMYFIPFTSLAVFNIMTWLEMRRAIARRAQLSTQEQKEHNLATMLLVVVLVFFICNLLPLVVNILELNSQNNQQLTNVSNFLVTINSSVNILIYCIFGKKFRTVFMQIFLGKQPPCILTSARSQYHHGKSTYTSNVPTESMKLIDLDKQKMNSKNSRQITVRFECKKNGGNSQNSQNNLNGGDHVDLIQVEENRNSSSELPELNGLCKAQVL